MDEERRERPVPRWLRDHDGLENVRRSRKHERRVASDLRGKTVTASGAAAWQSDGGNERGTRGGDVATDDFIIEHKLTKNASLGLKKAWLEKIKEAARQRMKLPALIVTFESPDGREKEDFVVISYDLFRRFADSLRQA